LFALNRQKKRFFSKPRLFDYFSLTYSVMKKISNVFYLLVALSLYVTIFSDIATAQTYQFAHYGVPEGLPVSKVNNVIQTDNGVVWLATGVGLTLFNGNEFINFGVNQGLYDQGVVVVLEDDNRAIWTGHYDGGLCRGDREGFQKIVLEDFDFQGDITAMSKGSDGSIWIGSMKQGLIQIKEIDKDTVALSDYSVFSNNKKIESLVISIEEFNDSIFVLTERGIRVKAANDTTFSTYLVEGIPAYRRFVSMAASDDYLFLGDTKGSLIIVDGNRKIKSQIKLVEKRSPISSLIFDKKSGFWAGLRDGTLVNGDINRGIKKTYTKENGLITGAIKTLLVDYEGNLLIGSYNAGLYIFKGNQFALFNEKDGILNNRVESICINSNDIIWLAGKDGISCIDTNGVIIQYTVENKGIPVNNIRLLASDCDGGIWAIANEYNVLHKKPDSKKFIEVDDFKRYFFGMDKVVSLSNDNNGKLWLGTLTGLLIYDINEKKSKRFYQRDKLSGSIISAIACNEDGNVFIGTQGNGLWSVSKELEFTQLLEGLTVNTLELQGDGGMLLGSDVKGVLIWENGKIVDTINKQNNGLLANYITTICANENLVLIGSASGLNVWNQQKDELYSFTAKSDFLGGEVLRNSIANSGDVFWIGTAKGAVRYIYKESGANILPPKVSIKKIRVNLEERELTQNLSFPYNENNFVFTYEGVCLTNPEAVKYSVRLKGLEETFTKPIKLAEISYNNLPYGDYCFEVLSANDQGVWNPNPVTYNFTINPPIYLRWYSILSMVALLILAIYLYITIRERNLIKERKILKEKVEERTQEIAKKNVELEDKNRDIMDSINYAKRIQTAVMRPQSELQEIIPNSFIYYRARDVVSGDYYWFSDKHGPVVLAAADCTGHGVPGAFMSMIGISHLNEIINEKKVLNPATILNDLRAAIIKVLRQSGKEDEAKEGMDMGLVVIDREKCQVSFSGAYCSLYIVRKNLENDLIEGIESKDVWKSLLYEVKGNRMPVGMSSKRSQSFVEKKVQLKKGDIFALSTDGYIDQFGGPKGKKFLSRRFKETLITLIDKSSDERYKILDDTFLSWKGDQEQIDDVLVIVGVMG